jgi:hypothetical protein
MGVPFLAQLIEIGGPLALTGMLPVLGYGALGLALKVEDQPVPPGGHRWPSLVEVVYAELTEKK